MSDQNLNISNLLKQLRSEKDLTQEQLAEKAHVHVKTIRRIELEKSSPNVETLRLILHALGINESEFYAQLYNIDMRQFNSDFDEILDLNSTNNHQAANIKLDELKAKGYCNMAAPTIKQAILFCDAVELYYLHKNYVSCFETCCEALQVTISNILSEDKIVDYEKITTLVLTINEFRILNIMANASEQIGHQRQALEISSALLVSIENNTINYNIKKEVLPLAYTNFSHRLLNGKSYAEALEVVERGLEFSRNVKEFKFIGELLCHKGTALHFLGEDEQASKLLHQAHDTFIKNGDTEYADIMRESAKQLLGIIVS